MKAVWSVVRVALLWLAGAVCLGLLLAVPVRRNLFPRHLAWELDQMFLQNRRPVEILVTGDSHARFAVSPGRIPKGMSVAVPGETYQKSAYRIPWLMEQAHPEIKIVVMGLDSGSFSSWKTDNFRPEGVWSRYVPMWQLAVQRRSVSLGGRAFKAQFFPWIGEWDSILQSATGTGAFKQGNQNLARRAMLNRRSGVEAATIHLQGQDPFDPVQVGAFHGFVDYLRERNIRVVLVSYPVSPGYTQTAAKFGADEQQNARAMERFKGDPGVVHFDYRDLYMFNPAAFYDGDHIQMAAKTNFTDQLTNDMIKVGWLPPRPPSR